MRGIGVAVRASTCGSPSVPFAWSAARCADAEAVLLVDDREAEPRERDGRR